MSYDYKRREVKFTDGMVGGVLACIAVFVVSVIVLGTFITNLTDAVNRIGNIMLEQSAEYEQQTVYIKK